MAFIYRGWRPCYAIEVSPFTSFGDAERPQMSQPTQLPCSPTVPALSPLTQEPERVTIQSAQPHQRPQSNRVKPPHPVPSAPPHPPCPTYTSLLAGSSGARALSLLSRLCSRSQPRFHVTRSVGWGWGRVAYPGSGGGRRRCCSGLRPWVRFRLCFRFLLDLCDDRSRCRACSCRRHPPCCHSHLCPSPRHAPQCHFPSGREGTRPYAPYSSTVHRSNMRVNPRCSPGLGGTGRSLCRVVGPGPGPMTRWDLRRRVRRGSRDQLGGGGGRGGLGCHSRSGRLHGCLCWRGRGRKRRGTVDS